MTLHTQSTWAFNVGMSLIISGLVVINPLWLVVFMGGVLVRLSYQINKKIARNQE